MKFVTTVYGDNYVGITCTECNGWTPFFPATEQNPVAFDLLMDTIVTHIRAYHPILPMTQDMLEMCEVPFAHTEVTNANMWNRKN